MTGRYRLAQGVRWVVGPAGLTVVTAAGHQHVLGYPEAAVWDLFSRPYAFAKVVSMTGHIADLRPAEAEAFVHDTLSTWVRQGLVEPVRGRMISLRPEP